MLLGSGAMVIVARELNCDPWTHPIVACSAETEIASTKCIFHTECYTRSIL